MLNRTNGYNCLIRFLRPAYLAIATEPRVVTQDEFADIFAPVTLKAEDFTVIKFVPGTGGSADPLSSTLSGIAPFLSKLEGYLLLSRRIMPIRLPRLRVSIIRLLAPRRPFRPGAAGE